MKDKIIADLGSNFKNGDDSIIEELTNLYSSIASNNSNRDENDEILYPYVFIAVKEAYLKRGAEGSSNFNDGIINSSYIDIEDKLKKDVISIRLTRL